MSKLLERSAKNSMREMADLNGISLVRSLTDYYIAVDQCKCELSPLTKATIAVENKKAAGQLDRLNQPIKTTYQPDPQIAELQKEIERLIAA